MNKTFTYILTLVLMLMGGAAMAQRTETPSSVTVGGSVFGGGNEAMVGGNCTVIINQDNATIAHDVYGGGALAKVNTTDGTTLTSGKSTNVTLMRGNVAGNLYGGGLGDNTSGSEVAADVLGPVTVTIEGGTVTGSVFGCNNLYGAPKNTVTVNVENDLSGVTMTLNNVYGGGNLAAYAAPSGSPDYPKVNINKGIVGGSVFGGGYGTTAAVTGNPQVTVGDLTHDDGYQAVVDIDVYGGGDAANVNTGTPVVLIQKCNTEIHGDVYGGGNAADVPATNVTVTGGTISGSVFGGGHGNKDATPDPVTANVETSTSVTINGGEINKVFGGSNSAGTINGGNPGGISVLVNKSGTCTLHLNELYGGGNFAASQVGSIDIRCTGTGDDDGIDYVYGGANQANITGDITLDIVEGRIGNVFGGNNTSGSIDGSITVNINKKNDACVWAVGNVYGGGNLASYTAPFVPESTTVYTNYPEVNILNGLVTTDVYGGGLGSTATVTGNPVVHVNGGSVGHDVFGGGSEAAVNGATHVTVTTGSVGQDVYGGGALANTGATTVDIMGGTITRDVYGGGLGDGSHAPQEGGAVTVNIGAAAGATTGTSALEEHSGNAIIGGNVYGCNNTAGSPQDNVTVNIYGTAHTTGVNTIDDNGYAIANVFGGGNQANFAPSVSGKKAFVNVYGCKNTIGRVFGGGNAAATPSLVTDIQGGRMNKVFGGGNGESGTGANVNGIVQLYIHGGTVGEFYGGSNQNGTISGQITTEVDSNGPCGSLNIDEFFCGGNFVDITEDLTTTIDCSDGMHITSLYGGCNQANITGNVTLNLYGGSYDYVYGGSKGVADDPTTGEDESVEAKITGDVTLNLFGGTITNVFGGSNVNGNITGVVKVNVLDVESTTCPLYITNIYGGSNLTDYQPTEPSLVSPIVNVVHAKYGISGNVYGGSKGAEGAVPPTNVRANPLVNIGYDASMNGYLPASYVSSYSSLLTAPRAIVAGSVFGGGDAAQVEGNTAIFLRNRAKVFGNVYGGGNMGEVTGNTKVIVNGANQ